MAAGRVYIADSRRMLEVQDECVHLVVTSPPYWQLKDYQTDGQIGFNDTYANYLKNLCYVWEECWRVLKPGCRLCVNVGDQFARSAVYGRYRVVPIHADIIRTVEALGFEFLGSIIWQKKTTLNPTGGAVVMGSYPYPRNGIVEIDYEHILLFRKPGRTPPPSDAAKKQSRLTKEEWKEFFSGHWRVAPARQNQHIAAFPEEIPARLIRMFTFVGETVLDPFLGSGTTAVAALKLARNAVGYEINPQFVPLIRKRLNSLKGGLFGRVDFKITERAQPIHLPPQPAGTEAIRDIPVKPRVSPKSRSYGSVMDLQGVGRREDLLTVRGVEGDRILLSDGRSICLAGIRIVDLAAYRKYVEKRLRGKRVRFEVVEGESGYLRLKNGIFVNKYLLKVGIAEPTNQSHRLKEQFHQIWREAQNGSKRMDS